MHQEQSDEWVLNIARKIYATLGRGFSERIYHNAFEVELRKRNIVYESEKTIHISYEGIDVGYCHADIFLKDYDTILEFKAIATRPGIIETEQINRYMRFSGIKKGLIINFGKPSLDQRDTVDFISVIKT